MTAIALTIAGSDSGGGAGIQADLKTFAFHRVHGTCALTCVTAQNTLGVERVESLSPEMVTAQIDAVVGDLGVQAVKTGMLFSSEIIEAVAEAIERWRLTSLVVDPVMVSRVGAKLIDDRALDSLFNSLIPLASIITPNRYEAQLLSGIEINDFEAMKAAAEIIFQKSATPVLVKGGGMKGRLRGVDICFDGQEWETFKTRSVETTLTSLWVMT